MGIHKAGDSWSRYDSHSYGDHFNLSKPQPKSVEHKPHISMARDSMEINVERLKKEALERLRHDSKYSVLQAGFVRIGKYLFMAVAMIPYTLVYGLPRWIVRQAFPVIRQHINQLYEQLQQWGLNQKLVSFGHFLKQSALTLVQPLVKIMEALKRNVDRFRHFVQRQYLRAQSTLKRRLGQVTEFWKGHFQKAKNPSSRSAYNALAEGFAQKKMAFQEALTAQWNILKSFPQQARQRVNKELSELREYFSRWPRKWKSNYQYSVQMADRATAWLGKKNAQCKQWYGTLKQPLKAVYLATLKPAWQQVINTFKGIYSGLGQELERRKANVREKLSLRKAFPQSFQYFQDQLKEGLTKLKFPLSWVEQLLQGSLVEKFTRFVYKVYNPLALGWLTLSNAVLTLLKAVYDSVAASWDSLSNGLAQTVTYIFNYLGMGWNWLMRCILKGVYYLLVMLIMMCITLCWGVRSGKQMIDAALKIGA